MAVLANIVHSDPPPATRAGPLEPVIFALMRRDPAARPDATGARVLLTTACSGYGAATSASGEAPAAAGTQAAAGVCGAGVAGAAALDPGPADGGNGATADGALDEPGTRDGTRPADGTLQLPMSLARDDEAFAGPPPAAAPAPTLTAATVAAHPAPTAVATAPAPAASGATPGALQGPGGRSRRRGRHRRALLFGGGGAPALLAALMIALALHPPRGCRRRGAWPRAARSRRPWRSPPGITG
jgi:hypothetical protein